MSAALTPKQRQKSRLFFQQKGCCYYCGEPMLLAKIPNGQTLPRKLLTLERVVPGAAGGGYSKDNTVAACLDCNQKRADGDARLFLFRKMGLA